MRISFIDNNEVLEMDRQPPQVLDNYDEAIVPFLNEYFGDSDHISVSTSGSTGKPKNITLEKSKMKASAKATLSHFNLTEKQTILLCLPTQFIAGKMIWVRALEGGLNVLVAKPSSNPIRELNSKVDFAAMTPHQVSVCLEENPEKFDLIDQLIIGGGTVSNQLRTQLQALKTMCYATYGMTETITHVAVMKLNGADQSEYYQAVGSTTFELGSRENLIIHAPHLSEDKIETQDVAHLIDSTTFEWLGRLDFVINSGGVKLFPEQIEKKLENVLKSNFFVWKKPDERLGEKLILVVEGKKNQLPDLSTVLDRLELPKEIWFVDQFTVTKNGKLDRNRSFQSAQIS